MYVYMYGDLSIISPTILSDKNLVCFEQYLARGVHFNMAI